MNKDNSTVKFPSDAEFFAELNGVAVDAQGNFYVGD